MEEIEINDKLNYVHLISGGLDSTYSLMKLTKSIIKGKKPRFEVSPVFFNYGQYAADAEFKCCEDVEQMKGTLVQRVLMFNGG
jgi:7-cyano-7-deazaguanine synthase in queuosine biosynthesis